MKFKIIIAGMCLSVPLFAISPYVKGYKLYIRYVKHIPKDGIKAPLLLKKLGINSAEEIDELIKTGEIVQKVKKFNPAAAKGIEKILKKGKGKELDIFLKSIYMGKIPPGCN